MAKLLYGKPIAERIRAGLMGRLNLYDQNPHLAIVQMGKRAAANVYVKNLMRRAESLSIGCELVRLPKNARAQTLCREMSRLNRRPSVTAIMVQMPLPQGISFHEVISCIDPLKDAEGVHPYNLGRLMLGADAIAPCTPASVIATLESYGQDLYGKNVVCVGHSDIVGKPLSIMLLNRYATTSICHVATSERGALEGYVRNAEVLISAVGKPGVIKGTWIRKGAVVVDVGITRVGDKLVGDVVPKDAMRRAAAITPVPGGIGPLTTMMLMRNVVRLFERQMKIK